MIEIARRRHREQNGRIRTYDVNLLSEKSLSGLKGAKSDA
jgi:D-alanine-D-alanine ligase